MSIKDIFGKFNDFCLKFSKFSAPLCSAMIFALFGLTFLNNRLNFDIPSATKVRDAANLGATSLGALEKLDVRNITEKDLASVPKTSYVSYSAPSYYYTYSTSASSAPAASNGFYISEPTRVTNPAVDAGYGIMRYMNYGGRFLYAHSSLAFSPLKVLNPGDTFTATIDGITSTYVVRRREVFKKSDLDSNAALRVALYSSSYRGSNYSLTLMTCGNGGNDDSSYRLLIFADQA